ncbi:MAG: hypothetical protein ACK5PS_15985 [Desulfopila sp.]
MAFDERDRKFFQPVWRRVLVIFLLSLWTVVEWLTDNPFWGTLTTGALIFAIVLSIRQKPPR